MSTRNIHTCMKKKTTPKKTRRSNRVHNLSEKDMNDCLRSMTQAVSPSLGDALADTVAAEIQREIQKATKVKVFEFHSGDANRAWNFSEQIAREIQKATGLIGKRVVDVVVEKAPVRVAANPLGDAFTINLVFERA